MRLLNSCVVEDDQLYASSGDLFHETSRLCLASEIIDCGIARRKPESALCVTFRTNIALVYCLRPSATVRSSSYRTVSFVSLLDVFVCNYGPR